ncbi:MAG: glucose 1-dehydrogenase [Methylobacteriaceae bacterium]|nr:glucose 1-dehydrogenase [Methylobacteriaceae bacterium]
MRLANKVAVVTGAAQGFGFGIAETYAKAGAKVACLDIQGEAAKAAAAKIGQGAFGVACDVSRADDVEAAFEKVRAALGPIDIVVNNAGTSHRNKPVMEVSEEEFDRVFDVNVKSIFLTTRAVVPQMRARGGGVIINIGSTAGIRPRPGLVWYNASKGAVNLGTKALAIELAADKIRVCCIAPVAGETPLLATFMGEDTPEKRAAFKASVPLGRLSTPQDIADACLFLAEHEFLTGVVLEVDGGRCI